jgi:hypothetical protein
MFWEDDDVWDDLLDELLPDDDGSVVVMRAYIDASSREHENPVNGDKGDLLTVAGYMFESRQQARAFSRRWKDTFRTDTFSWADLISARSKQFRHLLNNRREHDRLVAEGIAIVRQFAIAGTVASCWKQDVERYGPTNIKGFGHAYSIAGHMAMVGLGAWAKQNDPHRRIAYLIEAGDEGYDQLAHLLSYAGKSPEVREMYHWGGSTLTPKAPNSPFHAPDTLAWEWGKFVSESWVERKRPMRMSMVHLLRDRLDRYTLQHLYGEPLLRFFSQIRALGVEQMLEDRAAVSSVPSVDVSQAVQSSELPAPVGDPE